MATMDLKKLHETGKQISKATDGGDPPSTLLSLLQPLKNWTATEDLLRQSKIGVAVAKLRQNKDKQVSELASKLVHKWKNDVNQGKRKSTGSPAPAAAAKVNGAANGRASGTSSPAPAAPVKKEGRKSTVDPAKRTSKADGISTAVTGNQTRDACVELIYNGLAFMSEESPDDILSVARSVELAAYNEYQPETSVTYKGKMRSLFQNLKIKNNDALRTDVFKGEIAPEKFGKCDAKHSRAWSGANTAAVKMTGDELKSAEKRASDAAIEKENMRVAMTAQEQKAISTTYVLPCNPHHPSAGTKSARQPMKTSCSSLALQCLGGAWGLLCVRQILATIDQDRLISLTMDANIPSQDAMRQMQADEGRLHSGSNTFRR